MVGEVFRSANGGPRGDEHAAMFYKIAAFQWFPLSQYRLGEMYAEGIGVERNESLALMWLQLASNAGVPDARMALKDLAKSVSRELFDEAKRQAEKCMRSFMRELALCEF